MQASRILRFEVELDNSYNYRRFFTSLGYQEVAAIAKKLGIKLNSNEELSQRIMRFGKLDEDKVTIKSRSTLVIRIVKKGSYLVSA